MDSTYFMEELEREQRAEKILSADLDPLTKVQKIMRLGVDEDAAEELVSRYQLGQAAAVYYERLDD